MLKALKTMLKDDIINQNTWRIKCMGTQQALTTEQLEILILINDICDLIKEKQLENRYETAMTETVCGILCEEENETPDDSKQLRIEEVCNILKYYGYLEDNYFISIDGRQYLELLKEYIECKIDNPSVVNNNYTAINYIQLINKLEVVLFKGNIAETIGECAKFGNNLLQLIKKLLHK